MTADQQSSRSRDAVGVQAPLHKMLADPLRTRMLMQLGDRVASPKELSEDLYDGPDDERQRKLFFQRVCHQIRVLSKHGFVELVDEDTRRGGIQHLYRASVRPRLDADEWEKLPLVSRATNSDEILRVIVHDLRSALISGDFDAHRHRALLQKPMVVDEQGMREADESALRHLDELERIEAESMARRITSREPGIPVKTVTIVHPSAGSGLKTVD
jgi:DNA-binding transcriptional ArsR family regulator